MSGSAVLLGAISVVWAAAALVLVALAATLISLAGDRRREAVVERRPARWPDGADRPHVLVQIPVFDESRQVEGALRAAAGLDWPRDRLHVHLLDDSRDETAGIAAAIVAELRQDGFDVVHLRRADRRGFKAGALAAGLAVSDAPYVAIFDADFRALPCWLDATVATIEADPDIAFVQTRFEYRNRERSPLTRAQQLLVDTHFLVEQAGRRARGSPFQFNGTAGLWRRDAIEAVGGWSDGTLAEDLDLALRAVLAGWRGELLLHPACTAQAPERMGEWRIQQKRWSVGFAQVARRYLPRIWRADRTLLWRWDATVLLAVQAFFPALLLAVGAGALHSVLSGGAGALHAAAALGGLALALATVIATTWPAFRRLSRGTPARYLEALVSIPALFALLALANAPAVVAGPFRRRGAFVRTPKSGV